MIPISKKRFYTSAAIFVYMLLGRCNSQWWLFSRVLSSDNDLDNRDKSLCYRLYLNDAQLNACLTNPALLIHIGKGTNEAIDVCQEQFYNERWNCTNNNFNRKLYRKGTPETAYINAISSAGVTHKITELCDRGVLSNCGCKFSMEQEKVIDNTDPKKPFYWTFCKSHIKHGMKTSRIFLDPSKDETYIDNFKKNIKKLVVIHNNRAARKILWEYSSKYKKCKCHGPTGHCITRTCYRWLPELREVAQILYKRYYNAVEVRLKNMRKLISTQNKEKLKRSDLVYTERLNYCSSKRSLGIPGTKGRVCLNKKPDSSYDMTSCNILCCERGYSPTKRKIQVRCNCQFLWCCKVKCDICYKTIVEYVCK
nr:WntA protein [Cladonema pacificum]